MHFFVRVSQKIPKNIKVCLVYKLLKCSKVPDRILWERGLFGFMCKGVVTDKVKCIHSSREDKNWIRQENNETFLQWGLLNLFFFPLGIIYTSYNQRHASKETLAPSKWLVIMVRMAGIFLLINFTSRQSCILSTLLSSNS